VTAVLFVLLACSPAFANTSGTLVLQGTVPGILDISVSAASISAALDLSVTSSFVVASVTERSNKKAGYTVSLSSQNATSTGSGGPFLKGSDATNTDVLNYALAYNGDPVVLSAGSAIISDVSTKTPAAGSVKPLQISYAGDFLFEDTYSDTLTFTITAK
jgi:hypothetical protein